MIQAKAPGFTSEVNVSGGRMFTGMFRIPLILNTGANPRRNPAALIKLVGL